ncbi:hypothetical protein [Dyella nitratireducens]|uniref:hypothetical protein n=1 Tax=Dyella nitratireducens TaxID=1849580 RepID=UPI001663EDC4|nr:hypothetical protein [Dyella nitratireducens]
MTSLFSLRRFATSRLLRVTALLAWLLMAISLPAVSTHAMHGESHSAAGMASMMMDHATHADAMPANGDHTSHCCGGSTHPSCHCETMCSTVMLPSVPALYGPVRLAATHLSMPSLDTPTPNLIPPLRPPAV